MSRVTPEDVKLFHKLYEKYGTYAEVARHTAFSASTIRRYVGMGKMPNALKMAVTQTITK